MGLKKKTRKAGKRDGARRRSSSAALPRLMTGFEGRCVGHPFIAVWTADRATPDRRLAQHGCWSDDDRLIDVELEQRVPSAELARGRSRPRPRTG